MAKDEHLTVIAAAILYEGVVYTVPKPGRHHTVFALICKTLQIKQVKGEEQGFLLSDGRFARRKAAAVVAIRAGQIPNLKWPPLLYSEDLW